MQKEIKIWVLDDDLEDRQEIEKEFLRRGITDFEMFERSELVMDKMKGRIDVLVTDFVLKLEKPNITGATIVERTRECCSNCYVIVISGQDDKKAFIQLLNIGADWYIDKQGTMWVEALADAVIKGKKKVAEVLEKKKIDEAHDEEVEKIRTELNQYREEIKERIRKKETNGTQ